MESVPETKISLSMVSSSNSTAKNSLLFFGSFWINMVIITEDEIENIGIWASSTGAQTT